MCAWWNMQFRKRRRMTQTSPLLIQYPWICEARKLVRSDWYDRSRCICLPPLPSTVPCETLAFLLRARITPLWTSFWRVWRLAFNPRTIDNVSTIESDACTILCYASPQCIEIVLFGLQSTVEKMASPCVCNLYSDRWLACVPFSFAALCHSTTHAINFHPNYTSARLAATHNKVHTHQNFATSAEFFCRTHIYWLRASDQHMPAQFL